jgi:hypothetical protein
LRLEVVRLPVAEKEMLASRLLLEAICACSSLVRSGWASLKEMRRTCKNWLIGFAFPLMVQTSLGLPLVYQTWPLQRCPQTRMVP